MTEIAVTIKNKKAMKLLEDLASLDLIEIKKKPRVGAADLKKEKTATHIASEKSLGKDWLSDKEDKAWQDL